MNALVPLTTRVIAGAFVPTCDARALHAVLEVGRDFSSWIKERIAKYGFVENRDYNVFTETGENLAGGRPRTEYALTLNMGKELGMVENNDRGREVRLYFIDCEQRALAAAAGYYIPKTFGDALRLAADQAEQIERQQSQLELQKKKLGEAEPKVAFVDEFVNADGLYGLKNAGKALGQRPNKFIQQLKADGYLYHEGAKLVPYQRWIERGIFEVKAHQRDEWAGLQTYVTPKGLTYFADRLRTVQQCGLDLKEPAEETTP